MAEKKEIKVATPEPQDNPAEGAKAEAEEILKSAREEAEKILAEAREKAEKGSGKPVGKQAADPPGPKMVKIRLFKDNDKYKDDVFVAVNGKSYQIRRGEEVEVPDFVAEVLERSMKQDTATADLIERESSRYQQEAEARKI